MRASKYGRSIPDHVPTPTEQRVEAKRNAPRSWSLTVGTLAKCAAIALVVAAIIGAL